MDIGWVGDASAKGVGIVVTPHTTGLSGDDNDKQETGDSNNSNPNHPDLDLRGLSIPERAWSLFQFNLEWQHQLSDPTTDRSTSPSTIPLLLSSPLPAIPQKYPIASNNFNARINLKEMICVNLGFEVCLNQGYFPLDQLDSIHQIPPIIDVGAAVKRSEESEGSTSREKRTPSSLRRCTSSPANHHWIEEASCGALDSSMESPSLPISPNPVITTTTTATSSCPEPNLNPAAAPWTVYVTTDNAEVFACLQTGSSPKREMEALIKRLFISAARRGVVRIVPRSSTNRIAEQREKSWSPKSREKERRGEFLKLNWFGNCALVLAWGLKELEGVWLER